MDASDAKASVDVDGKPLETEEVDLFDDTDFYQQLLRDVIATKTAQGMLKILDAIFY